MPRAICGGGSSLGIAASDICPILPFFQSSNADQKLEILTLRPAKGAKVGGFRPAAAGAKALQGPFTCGTGELRSSRRVVSRRVRRALFLSLLAVCTRPNNITWIRSPRSMFCAISSRRTSHEYASGMPRAICGGGSSLGIAASRICRVVG